MTKTPRDTPPATKSRKSSDPAAASAPYRFSDLVDLETFKGMMQAFFEATGIANGLLDSNRNGLCSAGWQSICVKCHRTNPAMMLRCEDSDRRLINQADTEDWSGHKCLNGLMTYAVPIRIEGRHLATILLGQFLHEPPDFDFFRAQAQRFDLDEQQYLDYARELPVVPSSRIEALMRFYSGVAQLLADSGLNHLRQRETEEALDILNKELSKSNKELQALTAAQDSVQEEERKRIARELHDDLGQKVTVLSMHLHSLRNALPADNAGLVQRAEDMKVVLRDAARTLRQTAANLRSPALDELGLVAALQDLVDEFSQRTDVKVALRVEPLDLRVDSRLAMSLYRMAQESLTNVARHAQATKATVSLCRDAAQALILDVSDDGKGMSEDYRHKHRSFGLIGMRERAAMLGGEMQIRSHAGIGTSIRITIPEVRVSP